MGKSERCDVIVIGGALAGSLSAIQLARRGWKVTIIEKDEFPRPKLCGEFLSPESLGYLQEAGCLDSVLSSGATSFQEIRYVSKNEIQTEFPLPGMGLGISRFCLDQLLLNRAQDLGVTVFERHECVDIAASDQCISITAKDTKSGEELRVSASIAIGAYGRRSRLDQSLDRRFLKKKHKFVAFKQHFRPKQGKEAEVQSELRGKVEMITFPGGLCGVNFVEGDIINVCLMLKSDGLKKLKSPTWKCLQDSFHKTSPKLARRLQSLEPVGDVLTVAGMPFNTKERHRSRLLFLGDSAGAISPACGDGQAIALHSAILVANLFPDKPHDLTVSEADSMAKQWNRLWKKNFSIRFAVGQLLQFIILNPVLSDLAIWTLKYVPGLNQLMVRLTRGKPCFREDFLNKLPLNNSTG